MTIFSSDSRKYLVNKLSDFILSELPISEKSIIQVVDCENFYVIKGKTCSKDILDMNKVKDEFLKKNPDLKNEKKLLNTIDLIDYGVEIENPNNFKNYFYNSENCSLNQSQIEYYSKRKVSCSFDMFLFEDKEELTVSSTFPYGYSLDSGRILYYFAKFLVYNIPPNFVFEKIILSSSHDDYKFSFNFFDAENNPLQDLDSLFLDCLDLSVEKFRKNILDSDWLNEIENQENDLPFLKKKIGGIVLI